MTFNTVEVSLSMEVFVPPIRRISVEGLPACPAGLTIELSRITSLIGPNAAGKTTILRVLKDVLTLCQLADFDPTISENDPWYRFDRATIEFGSGSSGQPLKDLKGKPVETISLTYRRNDGSHFQLRSISADGADLLLRDGEPDFMPNPAVGKLDAELASLASQSAQLGNQLPTLKQRIDGSGGNTEARNHATRQYNDLHAQKKAIDDKRGTLTTQKNTALVELIAYSDGNGRATVSRSELVVFLKSLHVDQIHFIPARENPATSVDVLIKKAIASKKGASDALYRKVTAELSSLLQARVDIYELDDGQQRLTINWVDHKQASSGTGVCIYFYSMIYQASAKSVVLWDEPENGLHATRRFKLLDLALADSRQIVWATHGPELAPPMRQDVTVYQLEGVPESLEHHDRARTTIRVLPAKDRSAGFRIAEALGISPSATLFTATVVIWVEGPSDMLCWRSWLKEAGARYNLVDGFDYTLMMYGGSNLAHVELSELLTESAAADLLSLCRCPVIIVDSDWDSDPGVNGEHELKPHALRCKRAVDEINAVRRNSAYFLATAGREVENYFSDSAVAQAIEGLGKYEGAEADILRQLKVGRWERYFEAAEKHLMEGGVRKGEGSAARVRNYSLWGSENKVVFARRALAAMTLSDLKYDGSTAVEKTG